MAITHVFFDLDGTLVDSLPGIAYSAQAAIERVYSRRTAPDLLPFIGPPVREVFRRAIPEDDPEALHRLEEAFRESYDSEGWRQTKPFPGVAAVLGRLQETGLVCHVLTNKPKKPTHEILRSLALDKYFMEVITPESRKPRYASKTEALLDAQRRQALPASAGWVVGDSEDDGAAAAACGFKFVAAPFGYGGALQQCHCPIHFRLDRFEDLLSVLRTMPNPTR